MSFMSIINSKNYTLYDQVPEIICQPDRKFTPIYSQSMVMSSKRTSKCPPLVGGYLKSLYMKLEEIASRHHPENMICPGIYHLLNLVLKKKGAPQNFLIGQILPAVWIRWSVSSSQFFCHLPISVRPSQSRIKGKVRPTE